MSALEYFVMIADMQWLHSKRFYVSHCLRRIALNYTFICVFSFQIEKLFQESEVFVRFIRTEINSVLLACTVRPRMRNGGSGAFQAGALSEAGPRRGRRSRKAPGDAC